MAKKNTFSPPAIGGSSLLVIFGVLCLTVFALLSLTAAQADKRLSDSSRQAVTAYYEADCRAEEIFARLRGGETVPQVRQEGNVFFYNCPISEHQQLAVELQKTDDGWQILRWQAVPEEAAVEETLSLWDGSIH